MATDDSDFRIRPGRSRSRGTRVNPRTQSFLTQVKVAVRKAGGSPNWISRSAGGREGKSSGRFNARGRGVATALTLRDRSAWSRDGSGARTRARRVVVKARVVKLNPQRGAARGRQFVSAKAVDAHLRHLEGDGVTKDGEKGQVYSAERDVEDGRAFLDRGHDDRHQFRFIVSAEDGVDLADPRETTRNLMQQMEADLAACRTEVLSRVAISGIGRRSVHWPRVGRVRGEFMAFEARCWLCARLSSALRRASG